MVCYRWGNVVLDTTKVQIFKQITTSLLRFRCSCRLFQIPQRYRFSSKSQHSCREHLRLNRCFRYHKGTDFQANHNILKYPHLSYFVVLDTTKVQIFKQITTLRRVLQDSSRLFQIPQRYRFSSKSQHSIPNVNKKYVVLDTTKVQIFKQITTCTELSTHKGELFQIPQRYRFSSKSQLFSSINSRFGRCFRYHKGTDFFKYNRETY